MRSSSNDPCPKRIKSHSELKRVSGNSRQSATKTQTSVPLDGPLRRNDALMTASMPVLVAPWEPGTPTVTIANLPALDTSCKLMCAWAGQITVTLPAQFTVTVP